MPCADPSLVLQSAHALLVGTILPLLYAEPVKTLAGVGAFLSDPNRTQGQTLEHMLRTHHLPTGPHPCRRTGGAQHAQPIEAESTWGSAEISQETPVNQSLRDARDVAAFLEVSRSWVYHQAEATAARTPNPRNGQVGGAAGPRFQRACATTARMMGSTPQSSHAVSGSRPNRT